MADLFTDRFQTFQDCIEAISFAALSGQSPAQCLGEESALEINNLVASYTHAIRKECPAKTWWDCAPYHPAIARALKINRQQTGGVYALAPFRLWNDGERHLILAAYPAPRILGPIDMDHLDIEAVLAWNPITDEAHILGEAQPALFGTESEPGQSFTLYQSPRAFLTDWAINRAHAYVRITELRKNRWSDAEDRDTPPGALVIGNPEKVDLTKLPREFAAQGFDVAELNRTIIRQARLPRAHASQNRAAA
jgi:hypothetical protein